MLIPARTDTKWFHDYIYNKSNVQIRFLKGRLKFSGANNSAPFPSMIVIFNPLKKKDINVKEIVSLCDQAISIADNILNMKGVDDKNEKQD